MTHDDHDTQGEAPDGALHAERDGGTVHLSGTAQDLEELGQAVAEASAPADVEQVEVADVEVEHPDSGLWR